MPEVSDSKYVVMATWDDAPHLGKEEKQELWAAIPPHQRDARSKGVPQLGSGAIYPILEEDFVVRDFRMPVHWPRGYGLDVGWNRTAAVWGAHDRESDIVYLYAEHYRSHAEPVVHAEAVKARGKWMVGAIDPASRGRSQVDGKQLFGAYEDLGLNLVAADNAVEAGIHTVWTRLASGRLKVFGSLGQWLSEYRMYRRDKDGKVVKEYDHLMDATRYFLMTGLANAGNPPLSEVYGGNAEVAETEYDLFGAP